MVQIVGFVAAVIGALAFLPQVLKTWRARSATDLSLGMLLASVTAATLWVAYGISIQSGPVVVGNGVTLALASTLLFLKVRSMSSAACDAERRPLHDPDGRLGWRSPDVHEPRESFE